MATSCGSVEGKVRTARRILATLLAQLLATQCSHSLAYHICCVGRITAEANLMAGRSIPLAVTGTLRCGPASARLATYDADCQQNHQPRKE